jgi:calcium-dependent protein kinase
MKLLGNGKYGVVRMAKRINPPSTIEYAVKSIPKDEHIKKNYRSLKRELGILRILDHPNIIKLYEIFEDDKYVHIVTELCRGGDLFDYLLNKG